MSVSVSKVFAKRPSRVKQALVYRHVFLTGVSGGLGFALAIELITSRKLVCLTACSRRANADAKLSSLCRDYGVKLYLEHFDLRDESALEKTIKRAFERETPDLVIANAGISLTKSEDGIEDLFEINRGFDVNTKSSVKTLYLCLNLFLKLRQERSICQKDCLRLVAISSLASLVDLGSSPVYCASKAALTRYVRALSNSIHEKGIKGVRATAILPGFIKSAMSDRFLGRKLGIISAEQAAKIIISGIEKQKEFIVFPYILYFGIKLLTLMPIALQRLFLRFFSFNVAADAERAVYEQASAKTSEIKGEPEQIRTQQTNTLKRARENLK